jgi:hypothetical protein
MPCWRTDGPGSVLLHPAWVAIEGRFDDVRTPPAEGASERRSKKVEVGSAPLHRCSPEGEVLGLVIDERIGLAKGVVAITRPSVILRRLDHAGANGIEIAVPHDCQYVTAVCSRLNPWRLHSLGNHLSPTGSLLSVVPAREEMVDDLPEPAELGLTLLGNDDEVRMGAKQ